MDRGRESQKEILLIPLGKVLVDILEEIAVALRKTYSYHVRIGRVEEPDTSLYSDPRRQFDGERLLQLVAQRKRDSLAAVLGVVDADMFAGEKSFVFGLNLPAKNAGVIALARLREEFYKKGSQRELFFVRAVKEAIYQIGASLGLAPCQQKRCVLIPTTSLWNLDAKGQTLCVLSKAKWQQQIAPAAAQAQAPGEAESEEDLDSGPQGEQQVGPTFKQAASKEPEDESEAPAQMMEPDTPTPAEEAAVHPEGSGPEEPLIADR